MKRKRQKAETVAMGIDELLRQLLKSNPDKAALFALAGIVNMDASEWKYICTKISQTMIDLLDDMEENESDN